MVQIIRKSSKVEVIDFQLVIDFHWRYSCQGINLLKEVRNVAPENHNSRKRVNSLVCSLPLSSFVEHFPEVHQGLYFHFAMEAVVAASILGHKLAVDVDFHYFDADNGS